MAQSDRIALYREGLSRFTQQDFRGAVAALQQAVEFDPAFADAHQALAHCHEKLGELDAGLAAARRAVAHAPQDALLHTTLSVLCQRLGFIAEAEAEKAEAARLQPPGPP